MSTVRFLQISRKPNIDLELEQYLSKANETYLFPDISLCSQKTGISTTLEATKVYNVGYFGTQNGNKIARWTNVICVEEKENSDFKPGPPDARLAFSGKSG